MVHPLCCSHEGFSRIADIEQTETVLTAGQIGCPACHGPLQPWRHAGNRTVRDHGRATLTLRPRRARCQVDRDVLASLKPEPSQLGEALAALAAAAVALHARLVSPSTVIGPITRGQLVVTRRIAAAPD